LCECVKKIVTWQDYHVTPPFENNSFKVLYIHVWYKRNHWLNV